MGKPHTDNPATKCVKLNLRIYIISAFSALWYTSSFV